MPLPHGAEGSAKAKPELVTLCFFSFLPHQCSDDWDEESTSLSQRSHQCMVSSLPARVSESGGREWDCLFLPGKCVLHKRGWAKAHRVGEAHVGWGSPHSDLVVATVKCNSNLLWGAASSSEPCLPCGPSLALS